jgi:ubiquinone/menaquinone biosynthesis C-methylase UbiE
LILKEYFRCLYPTDPYIKFKIKDPQKRISILIKKFTVMVDIIKDLGFYKIKFNIPESSEKDIKRKTGDVYQNFWPHLKDKTKEKNFIVERFKNFKSININNFFRNKTVIDVGCGSGRYTYGISLLGAKQVFGIDFNKAGIKLAKKFFKRKNIIFKQNDVLNIKFKDSTFDVVFCNGVLQHTTDIDKGIQELFRICKPGGFIYLFVYGDGGIYFRARAIMNKIMKKIPLFYTQKILDIIQMPKNRFIFMDNWYVPIEQHSSLNKILRYIKKNKYSSIERLNNGRKTDLEYGLFKFKNSKKIWNEGHIKLLIRK